MELLAVGLCLSLLLAAMAPLWANSQKASEQAACASNLRQVGRAFHVWRMDHGNILPWRLPVAEGGTRAPSKPGAAWSEFASISNQLVTARVLACPSDSRKRPARDFSRVDGGLLNPAYRDNSVSYFIGLDAGYVTAALTGNLEVGTESAPDHILSGDRNLRVDALSVECSSGVNNAASLLPSTSNPISAWTNAIHGTTGNILLNDGQVRQLSNKNLLEVLQKGDDNGSLHLLIP